MTIQSINSTDEGLEVYWSNSSESCFPWFWLRDHSESLVDLHPDTRQRQIDSFSEPLDNTVNKVWLDENAQNLYVKWEDQSESCLSYESTRVYGYSCSASVKCVAILKSLE